MHPVSVPDAGRSTFCAPGSPCRGRVPHVDYVFCGGQSRRYRGQFRIDADLSTPQRIVVVRVAPATTGNNLQRAQQYCVPAPDAVLGLGSQENQQQQGQPLMMLWDGTSWKEAIIPPAGQLETLDDISCGTQTSCLAVGGAYGYWWDGSSWQSVQTPIAGPSLTCASSQLCWLWGQSPDGNMSVVRWDGAAFSDVTQSFQSDEPRSLVDGIVCSDETSCLAVGHTSETSWMERFDGNTWSFSSSASLSAIPHILLNSLVCPGGLSSCWAVTDCELGFLGCQTTGNPIIHFDGTTWSVSPTPPSTTSSYVSSMACPSVTQCWAVGADHYSTGLSNLGVWPFVMGHDGTTGGQVGV
jgi:hypothetical protein